VRGGVYLFEGADIHLYSFRSRREVAASAPERLVEETKRLACGIGVRLRHSVTTRFFLYPWACFFPFLPLNRHFPSALLAFAHPAYPPLPHRFGAALTPRSGLLPPRSQNRTRRFDRTRRPRYTTSNQAP
jgi:hypothetical protein